MNLPKKTNKKKSNELKNSAINTIKKVKNMTMHSLNFKRLFKENNISKLGCLT